MRSLLFSLTLIIPSIAYAELYECNGTWTNKPCDAGASRAIAAVDETNSPDDRFRSEKRSLLHELSMRTIKAREDYGVRVDLVPAQNVCLKPIYTLEQCQMAVNRVGAELDEQTVVASKLAADRKAIELQEEANRLQRERNEIEESKPNVAIVENRYYVVPRPGGPRPGGPRPGHPGYPQTQTGGSIQVQGNSASGNISGSISVDTTSGNRNTGIRSGMITDRPDKRRF